MTDTTRYALLALSPASAAPAPEAAHTEAVALSSMPDLQAIVKAGLEDGSLEIRGATSAAPAPQREPLTDEQIERAHGIGAKESGNG